MKKTKQTIFALILAGLLSPILALATAPIVLTDNAVNITFDTADLNGQLTDLGRYANGFYNQAQVWFEYGKTVSYGYQGNTRTIAGKDSFTEKLTGLSACTTYHFRAGAKNESETAYGADRVFTTPCQVAVAVKVEAQNITAGDGAYHSQVSAKPDDTISFKITIESIGATKAANISVKNVLPKNVAYLAGLTIAGVSDGRDITKEAIVIGDLAPKESKTIIFSAKMGASAGLPTGANTLLNTAIVYTTDSAVSASCSVVAVGTGVGVPTAVNTGVGTDILYSVILPLMIAFCVVFLFKSQIIGIDKLATARKAQVDNFRVLRKLNKLIQKRR